MSSKRQTTMAKLQRERQVEEKRTRKREKKEAAAAARKAAADDQLTAGPGSEGDEGFEPNDVSVTRD
jgi:uncharacterized protein YaiL (DUF2058 family)